MTELMTAILQRVGAEIDRNNLPQILVHISAISHYVSLTLSHFINSHSHLWQYEDEDKDKIVLASDSDLVAAVHHAKLVGWKVTPCCLINL